MVGARWVVAVFCITASTALAQSTRSVSRPRQTVGAHALMTAREEPAYRESGAGQPMLVAETRTADFEEPWSDEQIAANPCPSCQPAAVWLRAEYLHWKASGVELGALATSSLSGTAQTDAGVLPNAAVLFAEDEVHDNSRSGGRYSLGMWLTPDRTASLEASYLSIDDDDDVFSASSDSLAILARPFFNLSTQQQDARLIAFDGLVEGDLSIGSSTDFDAFELLLRRLRRHSLGGQTNLIFGYRTASLDDLVRIEESTTALSGPIINTTFDLFDQFSTENEFHGGQIGVEYVGALYHGWSLEFLAKVALGNTTSRASIDGQTTVTAANGDVSTVAGGLLTQSSNLGDFKEEEFSTLSEFGVAFRRYTSCGLVFSVGYSFLHWSDIARAGDQIDTTINTTQIPPGTLVGDARPNPPFERDDFWAQGLNLGLSYAF